METVTGFEFFDVVYGLENLVHLTLGVDEDTPYVPVLEAVEPGATTTTRAQRSRTKKQTVVETSDSEEEEQEEEYDEE